MRARLRILRISIFLYICFNLFYSQSACAWGRQGHSLIGETSARIIADKLNFNLLSERAYDVGYYSNVPDFIWKSTQAIYKVERHNHYMHIDIFNSRLPSKKYLMSALQLPRKTFNEKYKDIFLEEGRAFWRIRELEEDLTATTKKLKTLSGAEKHKLQAKWLLLIGVISHYVGDLSQPFHVTENYDGQKNGQMGIHAFYEETVVDYLTPELRTEVLNSTRAMWPKFHKDNKNLTTLEMLYQLTLDSLQNVKTILAQDKKIGRSNIKMAASTYHKQIAANMTRSSLVLAELISRQLDWMSDSTQFYLFNAKPDYIAYPGM